MALTALFAAFAAVGLLIVVLEDGAGANSPAPSTTRVSGAGWIIFAVFGLIALACYGSFAR